MINCFSYKRDVKRNPNHEDCDLGSATQSFYIMDDKNPVDISPSAPRIAESMAIANLIIHFHFSLSIVKLC